MTSISSGGCGSSPHKLVLSEAANLLEKLSPSNSVFAARNHAVFPVAFLARSADLLLSHQQWLIATEIFAVSLPLYGIVTENKAAVAICI